MKREFKIYYEKQKVKNTEGLEYWQKQFIWSLLRDVVDVQSGLYLLNSCRAVITFAKMKKVVMFITPLTLTI